jgi:hypothetical protein
MVFADVMALRLRSEDAVMSYAEFVERKSQLGSIMKKMMKWFAVALVSGLAMLALAQAQAPTQTPLGNCSLGSVATAVAITSSNCVFASFTGVIAGNVLTVSAPSGHSILPGQTIVGAGVPAGTFVVPGSAGTGTGGAGTYTINRSLTVASESMTTAGVPQAARYASICAYTQAVNWLDDGVPTAVVGTGGQGIPAGSCLPYNSPVGLTRIQFIQQTATAIVSVTFYQ